MKKNVYLLLFLLPVFVSYGQQNVLATVQFPGEIKDAIIREYEYPQTISYIKSSAGCCFALADNNLILSCAWLDCKYEINDFEILENVVYFCGTDNSVNQGVVGWFDCQDLFSGVDGYHVYNTYYAVTNAQSTPYTQKLVKVFSDLTIFNSPEFMADYVHLALVGETVEGTACVAEMIGMDHTNSWIYKTGGSANLPSNQMETMNQIVATDNYIVTGGTFESYSAGISLRVFDRNNMFLYNTLYDVIHRYSASATPCDGRNYPMYPTFRMSAAEDDNVSTASFFYVPELSYPPCNNYGSMPPYAGDLHGIVTHVFDIPTTITTPGAICAYNSLVYVNNNSYTGPNCGINSLTYSHPFSTLQVLAETNTPSSQETVLGEFSIPASTAIPYTIVNNCWFYHHDNFDGESKWVSIGKEKNSPNTLVFYTQPMMASNPQCGVVNQILTDIRRYRLKDDQIPLYLYNDNFKFEVIMPERSEHEIIIQCEQ